MQIAVTVVVQIIVTVLSIHAATQGVSRQLKETKEREITFKVHQQRKEKYEAFLSIIVDYFTVTMVRRTGKNHFLLIRGSGLKSIRG